MRPRPTSRARPRPEPRRGRPASPRAKARPTRQRFVEIEFRLRFNLGGLARRFSLAGVRAGQWARLPLLSRVARLPAASAWNETPVPGALWLLLALALAVVGQFLLNNGSMAAGAGAYVLAAVTAFVWLSRRPTAAQALLSPGRLGRRAELTLAALVLLIGLTARLYDAGNKPYGLDGDETKWVMQSYYSTIAHDDRGVFTHHFAYQPVSFYLQGLAMRVWGINLLAPRYLNAVLSSAAVVFFYFLVRRALGPPVAVVATLFYGVSFIALSAGRQALHDTHIEVWVLLANFLLIEAIETRRNLVFVLAGLAAALGLLTYETYYPNLLLLLAYLGITVARHRRDWRAWQESVVSFLLPIVLILPNVFGYIKLRTDRFDFLSQSVGNGTAWWAAAAPKVLANLGETLGTVFTRIAYHDWLLDWIGPLVNPWLLPFFAVGLMLALYHFRSRHYLFFVLWFGLQLFLYGGAGVGYPRVLYPSTMAIFALAGLGLCAALLAAFGVKGEGRGGSLALLTGAGAVMLALTVVDLSIFTSRLGDSDNRQKRRELADLVTASVRAAPTTYLPYLPFENDVIWQETHLIELAAVGVVYPRPLPADIYTLLPFHELLPRLWQDRARFQSARLIFDKTPAIDQAQREQVLATVLHCYPGGEQTAGRYFDVYTLPDLARPICHSLGEISPLAPGAETRARAGQPLQFQWQVADGDVSAFQLTVEKHNPSVYWLEAESFSQDGGWYGEAKFAADFTGSGYFTDGWHAGAARATVTVERAGRYTLWVRSYRRRINDQHNFVALDDSPATELSLGGEDAFDQWKWEAVGAYALEAGAHTLSLTRSYGSDPQFSVFIDSLALSADAGFDPRTQSVWTTAFDSGVIGSAVSEYTPARGLEAGHYRWQVRFYDGDRLVNWDGSLGVPSAEMEFDVAP